VGVVIALQLAWPRIFYFPEAGWLNFGRLRPLHTSGVIFAFGGNALIATSFYVVQRTCRARLAGGMAGWFVFWGYQLFIVMAAVGYLAGITEGREYAEPEWFVDLWLTIVWVVYLLVFLGTLWKRKEPHIYVANWFYLAFIVTVALLHIVNNLSLPVSLLGAKSYSLFAGVQDALTQWWYGHNAVGFFLTAGFLAIMYYFVPKRAEKPVYSYRLSIVHFWSLIFIYIWAGPHHLHYTALPQWAQTLGMTFSIMLWMPSWGGMINGLMTLSGAWDKLRTDPVLRMMAVAVGFYGMSTFEGPLMSIRAWASSASGRSTASFPGCGRRTGFTPTPWWSGTSGSRPWACSSTSPRCGCQGSARVSCGANTPRRASWRTASWRRSRRSISPTSSAPWAA
jgi:cytochrome c oxidase cbb3-type subunit 1